MNKLPRKKNPTDFSIRARSGICLRLEGDDENRTALKSTIKEIKEKYSFNGNYDLLYHLDQWVATGIQSFEEIKRQNPRPTDIKTHLEKIIKTAEQVNILVPTLINLLDGLGHIVKGNLEEIEKANRQKEVDYDIQQFNETISITKDNITILETELEKETDADKISYINDQIKSCEEEIKANEENKSRRFEDTIYVPVLKIIEERLLSFTEHKPVIRYSGIYTNYYLRKLISLSNQLIGNLDQKSDKGPQKGSSKEFLILQLLLTFRFGTGKRPTCGTDQYNDSESYTGEFYEFLKDINELLIKSNLGTSFALSKFSSSDVEDLKRLIDSDFTKIREINPQKDDYKRLSFTMTEILAIKKKLREIIEDVAKTLSAKLVSGVYLGEDSTIASYAKKLIAFNRKQLDEWEKNEHVGEDHVMLFPTPKPKK